VTSDDGHRCDSNTYEPADPDRSGGEGTGHHMHGIVEGLRVAWPDDACARDNCGEPLIVLDPVTARDTIDETLGEHFVMWHALDPGENGPDGEWRCMCGLKFGFSATAITHQRDSLLAALASQERGE
jgi:hypothetical protein